METLINRRNLGVTFDSDSRMTQARVWAPGKSSVKIEIHDKKLLMPLKPGEKGYWMLHSEKITLGDRYCFILDNDKAYPDPVWRGKHPLPPELEDIKTINLPSQSVTIYSDQHV